MSSVEEMDVLLTKNLGKKKPPQRIDSGTEPSELEMSCRRTVDRLSLTDVLVDSMETLFRGSVRQMEILELNTEITFNHIRMFLPTRRTVPL